MTDPRLIVDSKSDVCKDPIGFVPHFQEPSFNSINKFSKQSSLVLGIARSDNSSIANNISTRIASKAQAPKGKLALPSFFKAQLSMANDANTKVVISNSDELHKILQYYANHPPKKGILLQLKPGHYKMPSRSRIDKAFPITNLKNISIEALNTNNKPRIERIVLSNPENVHFKNIDFGVNNKKDWNHKNDGQTAIAINGGTNISIDNADISGMYDGINLKKGTTKFTLSNSNFHDIRRDAIISTDSRNTYILKNEFSAFHPNYENYNQENPKHIVIDEKGVGKLKPKKNVAYLTDKLQVPTDHSDMMQFANQEGDLVIKGNTLSAKGGAWAQGIFIHNENVKGERNKLRNAKIIIQDNLIQNNHKIGIAVQGQASVDESNNIISKIKTKGRKGMVTPTIDLNYRGYNK